MVMAAFISSHHICIKIYLNLELSETLILFKVTVHCPQLEKLQTFVFFTAIILWLYPELMTVNL